MSSLNENCTMQQILQLLVETFLPQMQAILFNSNIWYWASWLGSNFHHEETLFFKLMFWTSALHQSKGLTLKKRFIYCLPLQNGNLTLINFHFPTNVAPQLLKKLPLHSFPINHWLFSRKDSLKETVQKIQISSSVNKFPTPIEMNNQ